MTTASKVIATGFDFTNRVKYVGGGWMDGQIGTITDFHFIDDYAMAVVKWDDAVYTHDAAYAVAIKNISKVA